MGVKPEGSNGTFEMGEGTKIEGETGTGDLSGTVEVEASKL